MNNDDERDYEEEADNRALLREVDDDPNADKLDDPELNTWNAHLTEKDTPDQLFLGYSGHVGLIWYIRQMPTEWDPTARGADTYLMPALDGSTLYVTCEAHLTQDQAHEAIRSISHMVGEVDDSVVIVNL